MEILTPDSGTAMAKLKVGNATHKGKYWGWKKFASLFDGAKVNRAKFSEVPSKAKVESDNSLEQLLLAQALLSQAKPSLEPKSYSLKGTRSIKASSLSTGVAELRNPSSSDRLKGKQDLLQATGNSDKKKKASSKLDSLLGQLSLDLRKASPTVLADPARKSGFAGISKRPVLGMGKLKSNMLSPPLTSLSGKRAGKQAPAQSKSILPDLKSRFEKGQSEGSKKLRSVASKARQAGIRQPNLDRAPGQLPGKAHVVSIDHSWESLLGGEASQRVGPKVNKQAASASKLENVMPNQEAMIPKSSVTPHKSFAQLVENAALEGGKRMLAKKSGSVQEENKQVPETKRVAEPESKHTEKTVNDKRQLPKPKYDPQPAPKGPDVFTGTEGKPVERPSSQPAPRQEVAPKEGAVMQSSTTEAASDVAPKPPTSRPPQPMFSQVEAGLRHAYIVRPKSVTVKIVPEEMGQVEVQVSMENDQIKAKITAESQKVVAIIKDHQAELENRLADQGMELSSLDVHEESSERRQEDERRQAGTSESSEQEGEQRQAQDRHASKSKGESLKGTDTTSEDSEDSESTTTVDADGRLSVVA